MKGAVVHGVLLAVMLVYGYRTWTREKVDTVKVGDVVLWDKSDADLVSIEYKSDRREVKLEHKGSGDAAYWWGADTTIDKKPKKPTTPPATGSGSAAGSGSAGSGSAAATGSGSAAGSGSAGSGSAGSGSAGSGSGSAATPPPEMEETRKTREFPLGDNGDKLVKTYTAARALRDLGKPTDANKKDFKFDDAKTSITITFKDGKKSFLIGGTVYGGSDRYALDQASGTAYVLSKEMIGALEVGESQLKLTDPRGFAQDKLASVTIEAAGQSKTVVRTTATGDDNKQVKSWADPVTKKPNQTIANFIDNANNLRVREYATDTKLDGLAPIVTITYKDEHDAVLSTLKLYKREKPAVLPDGVTLDPANPPKGETEYLILTPRTRVPALVVKDNAERAEQDVPTVFSGKEVDSVDPKGNPFGKVKPDMLKGNGSPPPAEVAPPGGAPGAAPGGAPGAVPGGAAPGGAPSMMNPHGGAAPGGAAPGGPGLAPPPPPSGAPSMMNPHGAGPDPAGAAPATAPKAAPAPAPKKAAAAETPAAQPAPAPAPAQ